MDVIFSPRSKLFLEKCHPDVKKRILKKIKFYSSSSDPLEFADRLTDDHDAPYRYRVGDWRIKFSVDKGVMSIKRIGRRDSIYER